MLAAIVPHASSYLSGGVGDAFPDYLLLLARGGDGHAVRGSGVCEGGLMPHRRILTREGSAEIWRPRSEFSISIWRGRAAAPLTAPSWPRLVCNGSVQRRRSRHLLAYRRQFGHYAKGITSP